MLLRIVLACLVLAGGFRDASANGRPPAASSITFRQGQENEIVVGLTFGLVISRDGGKTWAWMCEDAIGYKGEFDPRFAFTASGALFSTTLAPLKVARDICTFGATPPGETIVSTNALGPGPDHALYYAAAQPADATNGIAADFKIYKSTDDGMTFAPTAAQPATPINWWQSLAVAPSDPQRLYLCGYIYDPAIGTQQRLFRSSNGGAEWTPLPLGPGGVNLPPNVTIDIVGIAKDNPDLVFMRARIDEDSPSDIYRSTDGGMTWTLVNHKETLINAFVVRAALNSAGKHDVIVGTQTLGAEISHDDGAPGTWTALTDPPHMNCLVENAAGELWACTQNYGSSMITPDDAAIMKTTDLVTWTKVLRYQELSEAVTCGPETTQQRSCAAMWCTVCAQIGCTPSPSYGCPVATEAPVQSGGCCDSGSGGTGALALGLSVGMLLLRSRRREP